MFPSKETVKLFIDISNRDGFAATLGSALSDPVNPKYSAILGYLKSALKTIDNTGVENRFCPESFASGFLSCFHMFRLQIESEDMDIEDLQSNIDSLTNYIKFLEDESLKLKEQLDEWASRTDTGVQ